MRTGSDGNVFFFGWAHVWFFDSNVNEGTVDSQVGKCFDTNFKEQRIFYESFG